MSVLVKEQKMIYGKGKSKVLYHEENEDGTGIVVKNILGSHPCGYITFKGIEEVQSCDDLWLKNAEVHGGFTFLGVLQNPDTNEEFNGTWIGWDYAHLGDYTYVPGHVFDSNHERIHTTPEIILAARKMLEDIRNGSYEIVPFEEEEEDYE